MFGLVPGNSSTSLKAKIVQYIHVHSNVAWTWILTHTQVFDLKRGKIEIRGYVRENLIKLNFIFLYF